jgi:hypothetical protein
LAVTTVRQIGPQSVGLAVTYVGQIVLPLSQPVGTAVYTVGQIGGAAAIAAGACAQFCDGQNICVGWHPLGTAV